MDDTHITVTTYVEISEQFCCWLLSFDKKAKIVEAQNGVEYFAAYLNKVMEIY